LPVSIHLFLLQSSFTLDENRILAFSYSSYHLVNRNFLQNNADLLFGGITIVCGIFGTLSGGFILDYMGATISNAFRVSYGASEGYVMNGS
jgi:hypothetical protein